MTERSDTPGPKSLRLINVKRPTDADAAYMNGRLHEHAAQWEQERSDAAALRAELEMQAKNAAYRERMLFERIRLLERVLAKALMQLDMKTGPNDFIADDLAERVFDSWEQIRQLATRLPESDPAPSAMLVPTDIDTPEPTATLVPTDIPTELRGKTG